MGSFSGVRRSKRFLRIYQILHDSFGSQYWWPGETPFEVMVGAVLTQNTNWKNVEQAISNLKAANMLSPEGILALSENELADYIRPSGYFNVKAKRLKNMVCWYVDSCAADNDTLRAMPLAQARPSLLGVNGVGRETADSILLYAGGMETFVVDAYTGRIFSRLGMVAEDDDYETMRKKFMRNLPADVEIYNEYHALIVNLGKYYCRPRPRCEGCPLRSERHRCRG